LVQPGCAASPDAHRPLWTVSRRRLPCTCAVVVVGVACVTAPRSAWWSRRVPAPSATLVDPSRRPRLMPSSTVEGCGPLGRLL